MQIENDKPVRMKHGVIMETKSVDLLIMVGDEVARVESLVHDRRAVNQHEAN